MLGGFSPFGSLQSVQNTVSSIPEVDTEAESEESSTDNSTEISKQSPFSTLNSSSNTASPFSTLNAPGGFGAVPKSPFSTLANPSLVSPFGPYGTQNDVLRILLRRRLTGASLSGSGFSLPFGLQTSPLSALDVPFAPGAYSALNNPVFQQILNPGLGGPNVVMFQRASLNALVQIMKALASDSR